MVLYVKIIKKLKKRGKTKKIIYLYIRINKLKKFWVIKHIYHLIKLKGFRSLFKKIRFKMSFKNVIDASVDHAYSSELQLSNIEVIKAWTKILALSSSIYFVIWVTTQTYKPYTATHVFEPINAKTPFEQVHAVPDLEFLARFQRQRGREIIKERSWWFGCGSRQL